MPVGRAARGRGRREERGEAGEREGDSSGGRGRPLALARRQLARGARGPSGRERRGLWLAARATHPGRGRRGRGRGRAPQRAQRRHLRWEQGATARLGTIRRFKLARSGTGAGATPEQVRQKLRSLPTPLSLFFVYFPKVRQFPPSPSPSPSPGRREASRAKPRRRSATPPPRRSSAAPRRGARRPRRAKRGEREEREDDAVTHRVPACAGPRAGAARRRPAEGRE